MKVFKVRVWMSYIRRKRTKSISFMDRLFGGCSSIRAIPPTRKASLALPEPVEWPNLNSHSCGESKQPLGPAPATTMILSSGSEPPLHGHRSSHAAAAIPAKDSSSFRNTKQAVNSTVIAAWTTDPKPKPKPVESDVEWPSSRFANEAIPARGGSMARQESFGRSFGRSRRGMNVVAMLNPGRDSNAADDSEQWPSRRYNGEDFEGPASSRREIGAAGQMDSSFRKSRRGMNVIAMWNPASVTTVEAPVESGPKFWLREASKRWTESGRRLVDPIEDGPQTSQDWRSRFVGIDPDHRWPVQGW